MTAILITAWIAGATLMFAVDTLSYLYNTPRSDWKGFTFTAGALVFLIMLVAWPLRLLCSLPRWTGMLAGLVVRQYMEGYRSTRG